MSKVALVRCESYEYNKVKEAVKKGIDLIGGMSKFSNKNEKILLKPNLLMGFAPEKCVTTHPSVFKAVAEIFKSNSAKVSYGDSPGFGSTINAAKKAGLVKIAEELDIKLADFKNGKEIFFEKGIQNKKFFIAKAVLENDAVISIGKLKTHGLMKMTCAVKNQFGCIPGTMKAEYHVKLPSAYEFGKMLIDLDRYIKPKLYIIDGIKAMDGNGPSGGTPIAMNVLLFSTDPIALDATICRLVNVKPELVPTNIYGKETGHGTFFENEIELVGDDFNLFKKNDFQVDRSEIKILKSGSFKNILSNLLIPKPIINKLKCVKCGVCINICPVKPEALNWSDQSKSKPPAYNYTKCIRCFCCQELCPENAISLKRPFIRSLISSNKK